MSKVKPVGSISGFLNVNKPAGITSHDVIAKLRKWTNIKRIGHAGTLDPDATGVLPIAIGNACRLISYLPQAQKVYLAEILLGTKTTTDDISGIVLEKKNIDPSIDRIKIESALKDFIGLIEQVPPIYSAVKHKGQRLYQLARAKDMATSSLDFSSVTALNSKLTGILANIKPRTVNIEKIDLLNEQLPLITLRIHCSAGTYIRSIARDLGESLNCGACLQSLCREKSSSFDIQQSFDLNTIQQRIKNVELSELLINPEVALNLKRIELDRTASILISQGRFIHINTLPGQKKHSLLCNELVFAVYEQITGEQKLTIPIALIKLAENGFIQPEIVLIHADQFSQE